MGMKETVLKLKKNKRLLFEVIKDSKEIYNNLCPMCRLKKISSTREHREMSMKDYCEKCQKMIKEKFGEKYG
jgi:predicted SprT family Zn-dependent metalloprotease